MTMTTIRTLIACGAGTAMLAGCAAGDHRAARSIAEAGKTGEDRATAALADQTRRILAQRDGAGAVTLAERLVARHTGPRIYIATAQAGDADEVVVHEQFLLAQQLGEPDARHALALLQQIEADRAQRDQRDAQARERPGTPGRSRR